MFPGVTVRSTAHGSHPPLESADPSGDFHFVAPSLAGPATARSPVVIDFRFLASSIAAFALACAMLLSSWALVYEEMKVGESGSAFAALCLAALSAALACGCYLLWVYSLVLRRSPWAVVLPRLLWCRRRSATHLHPRPRCGSSGGGDALATWEWCVLGLPLFALLLVYTIVGLSVPSKFTQTKEIVLATARCILDAILLIAAVLLLVARVANATLGPLIASRGGGCGGRLRWGSFVTRGRQPPMQPPVAFTARSPDSPTPPPPTATAPTIAPATLATGACAGSPARTSPGSSPSPCCLSLCACRAAWAPSSGSGEWTLSPPWGQLFCCHRSNSWVTAAVVVLAVVVSPVVHCPL